MRFVLVKLYDVAKGYSPEMIGFNFVPCYCGLNVTGGTDGRRDQLQKH